MEIKTIIRCHLTYARMAIILKMLISVLENVQIGNPCALMVGMEIRHSHNGSQYGGSSKN